MYINLGVKPEHSGHARRKRLESITKVQIDSGLVSRLEEGAERLHSYLDLGYKGFNISGISGYANLEWRCEDLYVQQTFSRAFLAYVEIVTSNFDILKKSSAWLQKINKVVEKSVPAIDMVLRSIDPNAKSKSVLACALLACKSTSIWIQVSPIRLIHRFATLLDDRDSAIVENACKSMVVSLTRLKIKSSHEPSQSMPASDFAFCKSLFEDVDPLARIMSQITKYRSSLMQVEKPTSMKKSNVAQEFFSISPFAYSGLVHVFHLLVEKFNLAKEAVLSDETWIASIIDICHNSTDANVLFASFCAASSIACDSHIASKFIKKWSNFFSDVCRSVPSLDASHALTEKIMKSIAALSASKHFWNCLQAIEAEEIFVLCVSVIFNIQKSIDITSGKQSIKESSSVFWASIIMSKHSVETLCISVLQAIMGMLSFPGKHHRIFIQSGLVNALTNFFVPKSPLVQNVKIRFAIWKILQCIGNFWEVHSTNFVKGKLRKKSHALQSGERIDLAKEEKEVGFRDVYDILPLFLSEVISKAHPVCSTLYHSNPVVEGINSNAIISGNAFFQLPDWFSPSVLEIVEINKAAVSFLFTPSHSLSAVFNAKMLLRLSRYTTYWAPIVLDKVYRLQGHCISRPDMFLEEKANLLSYIYFTIILVALTPERIPSGITIDIAQCLFAIIYSRMGAIYRETGGKDYHDFAHRYCPKDIEELGSCNKCTTLLNDPKFQNLSVHHTDDYKRFDLGASIINNMDKQCNIGDNFSSWEGTDALLFASVKAFSIILCRYSDLQNYFQSADRERLSNEISSCFCRESISANVFPNADSVDKLSQSIANPDGMVEVNEEGERTQSSGIEKRLQNLLRIISYIEDSQPLDILTFRSLISLVSEKYSHGVRCYACKALSCFGVFGFVSAVGEDMNKSLTESDSADVSFLFPDGYIMPAHRVVIASRCPFLLSSFSAHLRSGKTLVASSSSPEVEIAKATASRTPYSGNGNHLTVQSSAQNAEVLRREQIQIRLSQKVDCNAFLKLLQFVYRGVFVSFEERERVELLKLARACRFDLLAFFIIDRNVVFGTPPLDSDYSAALNFSCLEYSDVVLKLGLEQETKNENDKENELACAMKFTGCNLDFLHCHSHRVILASRCQYFSALFRSHMRDSYSGQILVPARNLLAISAFLRYLYSGRLCFEILPQWTASMHKNELEFKNLLLCDPSKAKKIENLIAAMRLIHLAELYLMDDLSSMCEVFILKKINAENAVSILKCAYELRLWGIVEEAVNVLAADFVALRDSGALSDLHDDVFEAIRAQHVKLWRV